MHRRQQHPSFRARVLLCSADQALRRLAPARLSAGSGLRCPSLCPRACAPAAQTRAGTLRRVCVGRQPAARPPRPCLCLRRPARAASRRSRPGPACAAGSQQALACMLSSCVVSFPKVLLAHLLLFPLCIQGTVRSCNRVPKPLDGRSQCKVDRQCKHNFWCATGQLSHSAFMSSYIGRTGCSAGTRRGRRAAQSAQSRGAGARGCAARAPRRRSAPARPGPARRMRADKA